MTFVLANSGYVPLRFDNMAYLLTSKMNVLVQAGVIVPSKKLTDLMANGGSVFELPFWNDIANSTDRVSNDSTFGPLFGGASYPTPDGLTSSKMVAARICRNQSWGASDLSDSILLDGDPMSFIAGRAAQYMSWKLQAYFLNECVGLFADNDLAPTGTDTHTQFDLTLDISNAAGATVFSPGVTTFGAAAHIKALQLLGDNKWRLTNGGVILMHSIIEAGIALQDLIETIRDSDGQVRYKTFMGMRIVIDDDMTQPSAGVYDTYYFGMGAFILGKSTPKKPLAFERYEGAGNGAGAEVLYQRWEWCLHPLGFRWLLAPTSSGPLDTDLIAAANWSRIYPERKQVPIVRVRSREA